MDSTYETYPMDDLGNRVGSAYLRDTTTDTYDVDELTNRYDSIDSVSLIYDAAGNLIEDHRGYQYYYDYENRLVEILDDEDQSVAMYVYDALGRRIEKGDPLTGEITRYFYSPNWQVLYEVEDANEAGTVARKYVYGNFIDEPLMMITATTDYYYVHDHLFSPVALINGSGTIVERYEYDAYGKPTIYNAALTQTYSTSQFGNPYLFTGRRVDFLDDNTLTLQYNRNRYYDYTTGRWLTPDPLGVVPNHTMGNAPSKQYRDGLSFYQYVFSRPANALDATGLGGAGGSWTGDGGGQVPVNPVVCCKLKDNGVGRWRASRRCRQVIIANPNGQTPMGACRCRFEGRRWGVAGRWRTTVYDAHYGPCCWCELYLERHAGDLPEPEGIVDEIIINHTPSREKLHGRLAVICSNGGSWTRDIDGPGEGNVNVVDYSGEEQYVRERLLGHISCAAAARMRDRWPEKTTMYYNEAGFCGLGPGRRNCWTYPVEWAEELMNECP